MFATQEMSLARKEAEAMRFVGIYHSPNQMYGEYPYITHLYQVVCVAHEFGFKDHDIVIGCWLHDVIEDGAANYNTVRETFGEVVAEIVYAVTDEKGKDRHERHVKTHPGIAANRGATIVKLCDRIANVRWSTTPLHKSLLTYREEYPEFREALYPATEPDLRAEKPLWDELDRLLDWQG